MLLTGPNYNKNQELMLTESQQKDKAPFAQLPSKSAKQDTNKENVDQ